MGKLSECCCNNLAEKTLLNIDISNIPVKRNQDVVINNVFKDCLSEQFDLHPLSQIAITYASTAQRQEIPRLRLAVKRFGLKMVEQAWQD